MAAILLHGGDTLPYRLGETVSTRILAPHDFLRENSQRRMALIKQARENTPSIYTFNDALITSLKAKLADIHALAKSTEDYQTFQAPAAKHGDGFTEEAFKVLRSFTDEAGARRYDDRVNGTLQRLAELPIVRRLTLADRDTDATVAALIGGLAGIRQPAPRTLVVRELILIEDREQVVRVVSQAAARHFDPVLAPAVAGVIVAAMYPPESSSQPSPVWVFDKDQTNALLDQAQQSVPIQYDRYAKGDVLVAPGVIDELEHQQIGRASCRERV